MQYERPSDRESEHGFVMPFSKKPLTRRDALRISAATAFTIGISGTLAACTTTGGPGGSQSAGVTAKPTEEFKPDSKAGAKPNLPRVLGWSQPAAVEFWNGFTKPMQAACDERGVTLLTAVVNTDASTMTQQVNTMLQKGLGALCIIGNFATPTSRPLQQAALGKDVAVFTELIGPSTNQVSVNQKAVGLALGKSAAKWIKTSLNGKAKVAVFNFDQNPALVDRHQGILEGVKSAGSGVEIVSDISFKDESNSTGFQLMNTMLQAHPEVDIVLSTADSIAMGALSAMQTAGKVTERTFVGGVNGDADALDKIKAGGPYKSSIAFAFPLSGYATAQYAADYLDGKSIPTLTLLNPVMIDSPAGVDDFQKDMSASGVKAVFSDYTVMKKYMTHYGRISYESRTSYLTGDYS